MPVQPLQYGHFGNPGKTSLETDPRTDPGMLKILQGFGMAGLVPSPPIDLAKMDDDAVVNFAREGEKGFLTFYNGLASQMPPEEGQGIEYTRETVKNPDDGHEVELHIHRPANHKGGPLPCVAYLHGGGMIILETYGEGQKRWTRDLARAGLVTINVGFRNGSLTAAPGSGRKYETFPVGLNDCVVAIRHIAANRERLGIGKLVVMGESGGANLSIAATMKMLREGQKGEVDGVYAIVPYVSGAYGQSDQWKVEHGLNSMVENEGYFLNALSMAAFVKCYTPNEKDTTNPLAWPWYASKDEFKDFPPTIVSTDELDPLRDEGMQIARKIASAGVQVVSRMNLGIIHAAECMEIFAPNHYKFTIGDIKRFADSL